MSDAMANRRVNSNKIRLVRMHEFLMVIACLGEPLKDKL
jgi:hypothetical protein